MQGQTRGMWGIQIKLTVGEVFFFKEGDEDLEGRNVGNLYPLFSECDE